MRESGSEPLRERPGGARRADNFLLVIATVLAVGVGFGVRSSRQPFISLLFAALWLDVFARWLRHVRPQYASVAEHFSTLALGAALYAGWAGG